MSKIAFATVCVDPKRNGTYVTFFKKLIITLKSYNTFHFPFYVFCDSNLTKENREDLKKYYDFIFYDVDKLKYSGTNKNNPKFYSLEAFNLNYDKVIFLDTDIICRQDISILWQEFNEGLWMFKERRRPTDFNSGVMVINKEYLTKENYNTLMALNPDNINRFGNDQKLINHLFGHEIKELEQTYNTLVSEIDFIGLQNVRLLHYTHKPNLKASDFFYKNYGYLKELWQSIQI